MWNSSSVETLPEFSYIYKNQSEPALVSNSSFRSTNNCCCCQVGYFCCPVSAYCCASGTDSCCEIGAGQNDCGTGKNSDCCFGWSCPAGNVCYGEGRNGQCHSMTSDSPTLDDDGSSTTGFTKDMLIVCIVVPICLLVAFCIYFCCCKESEKIVPHRVVAYLKFK